MDLSWVDPESVRPLRRREYDRLVELGAFSGEQIELVHGVLLAKEPQGPRHAAAARNLAGLLTMALAGRAQVQAHSPIALMDESQPEPDVAVIPLGDYTREHPSTAHLVVEVAESSLHADRTVKEALYAGAGIPVYWIVNLPERVMEVKEEPVEGRYSRTRYFRSGDRLSLDAFPDVTVAVDDVLR